jgi:type IV secretory pathway TrbF-like protein
VLSFLKRRTKETAPLDAGAFVVPPGKLIFNDVRAQAEVRAKNATLFAWINGFVAIAAIVFAIIAANNPRPVPHVMYVGADGHGQTLQPVKDDPTLRDLIVGRQLKTFVRAIFTRTGSFVADQTRLKEDVTTLITNGDPSYTTINARFADPSFNLKTANTLASVAVDAPQKRAPDSWYIKWTVTTMKPDGAQLGIQNYDATVIVKFNSATSSVQQENNPTGLDITTFPYQTFNGGAGQ